MNEKTEQPLAAQLAAIVDLPPGASDADIVARVSDWARARKQYEDGAAFEQRVANMVKITNMSRQSAIETLKAQDGAREATGKATA